MDRQICEGCDYKVSHKKTQFCMSQAHWRVVIEGLTLFLCTTCHAIAELGFAKNCIPRHTDYAEKGYERQPGHDEANRRYDARFGRPAQLKQEKQMGFNF
jgi:hypothetical protein